MTGDESKKSGDVVACGYLSSRLKEAFKSGELPELFKNETVEFQSAPHRDGWVIHWVFRDQRIDHAYVDSHKTSQWDEDRWTEWSQETVWNWIDAYTRPLVDTVDLDSVEEEQVGKRWAPNFERLFGDYAVIYFKKMESAMTFEMMKGMGVPKDIAERPFNPFDLPPKNESLDASPDHMSKTVPLSLAGSGRADKLFTDILQIETKLTVSDAHRTVVIEFTHPAYKIPTYCFSWRSWITYDLRTLLETLKDFLSRHLPNVEEVK